MSASRLPRLRRLARRLVGAARARVARWARPAPLAVAVGAAAGATRSRSAPLRENAPLRHQLVVLGRAARPRRTATDRALLVLPAGCASGRARW